MIGLAKGAQRDVENYMQSQYPSFLLTGYHRLCLFC